jgi:hypothetical protein
MKTKFTGDIKVIEVLNPMGHSVGTIRRSKTSHGFVYYARGGFDYDEVYFQTEKAARCYLIDLNESENSDMSIEEYLRAFANDY